MATLRDVLQYVAYNTALDITETDEKGLHHLFSKGDLITRELIEEQYPHLLDRELYGGIHGEGFRRDTLFISLNGKY